MKLRNVILLSMPILLIFIASNAQGFDVEADSGIHSIELYWEFPSDGVSGHYEIWRQVSGNMSWPKMVYYSTDLSLTIWADTDVEPGICYDYEIKLFDAYDKLYDTGQVSSSFLSREEAFIDWALVTLGIFVLASFIVVAAYAPAIVAPPQGFIIIPTWLVFAIGLIIYGATSARLVGVC